MTANDTILLQHFGTNTTNGATRLNVCQDISHQMEE